MTLPRAQTLVARIHTAESSLFGRAQPAAAMLPPLPPPPTLPPTACPTGA